MFLKQVVGEVLELFMGGQGRERLRLVGPGVALPVRHGEEGARVGRLVDGRESIIEVLLVRIEVGGGEGDKGEKVTSGM